MTNRKPVQQKFLYHFLTGQPGPGDLIIHPRPPWCVGEVYHERDKVRVVLRDWSQPMTEDDRHKMALEMKNKYYFTHVEGRLVYEANMRRIEELMLKGSDNLSAEDLSELERLAKAAEQYEQTHHALERPTPWQGILERTRIDQQLGK